MQDLMIKYMGLNISKRIQAVQQGVRNMSKLNGKSIISSALKMNYIALRHYPTA